MTATVHKLPRFDGEPVRRWDNSGQSASYPEAMRLMGQRSGEWVERLQAILAEGPHYRREADGADHVLADGATLQSLGEDLAGLAYHLERMAAQIEEAERRGGDE